MATYRSNQRELLQKQQLPEERGTLHDLPTGSGGISDNATALSWRAYLKPSRTLSVEEVSSLGVHPLAAVIREQESKEFAALLEDVRRHGIAACITLMDGLVLDGRHRLRCAQELGLTLEVQEFTGGMDLALNYVASANVHRRSLTQSQRAAIYLLNEQPERRLSHGGPRRGERPEGVLSAEERARIAGVEVSLLRQGQRLLQSCRHLLREVAVGPLSIGAATKRCFPALVKEQEDRCGCNANCPRESCPTLPIKATNKKLAQRVAELEAQLKCCRDVHCQESSLP